MITREEQMKKEIMSRTRAIYYMRTIVRPFFVELGLLVLAALAMSYLISVPHIVANARAQGALNSVPYLFRALLHTRVIVQLTLAVSALLLVLVARDALKSLPSNSRQRTLLQNV